jgi:hypothetical protein
MNRVIVIFIAVLAISGARLASYGQTSPDAELARIYNEYSSFRGELDVGRLVQLDQELRRLLPYWSWEGVPASSQNYRPDYEAIGVGRAMFEPGSLVYSGKLLLEAHRKDPRSRRSYTLYSTVFGVEGEAGNSLPSPVVALAYLQEFPNGPFALYAHLATANFFADLFKVIQAEEAGKPRDYKYECFKTYIAKGPLPPQRSRAQAQAVEHYLALTRLRPEVKVFSEWLADMQKGQNQGWRRCAD